jgi:pyridoxine 4-dehydrogenase
LASGATYWNAAPFYGTPEHNSLTIIRRYLDRYPEDADRIVLSVKGCLTLGRNPPVDGSAAGTRASIEECLSILGDRVRIHQFEPARVDPLVPFEETVAAVAEFVKDGRIGGLGLSEVSASTIHRAAKVTKVTSVEVEVSLWQTEPLTNGVAEVCAELGIPIVAYCTSTSFLCASFGVLFTFAHRG